MLYLWKTEYNIEDNFKFHSESISVKTVRTFCGICRYISFFLKLKAALNEVDPNGPKMNFSNIQSIFQGVYQCSNHSQLSNYILLSHY